VCVPFAKEKKGMTTLLLNKFFMGWEGRAVVEKSKIVKREILIYFSLLRNESEPLTRKNQGLTEIWKSECTPRVSIVKDSEGISLPL